MLTVEQIDSVLEQLYTNGSKSVQIGDKKYEKYDIKDLIELRELLLNNTNLSTGAASSKTILKVRLSRAK